MDILTISLMTVALVCALLAFIAYRSNSRNAEALVKMSADKSAAENEVQIIRNQLEEAKKDQIDVHRFQVENAKLQENLSNAEQQQMQVARELNSARERRDELQGRVQELTAEVSKLEANLNSGTDTLQKESGEKNALAAEHSDLQQQHQKLTEERTQLEEKVKNAEERLIERNELEKLFSDKFKALSSDVLKVQGESFKSNAEEALKAREEAITELVKPLSERIKELDRAQTDSAAALREQITTLTQANKDLASEANKLSSALTKGPRTRGTWGEMQVERAIQLSGLTKEIHYKVQVPDQQGGLIDFIVHLPHERDIIIDSKVSMNAYLEAEDATDDEERTTYLVRHARSMKDHVDNLAKKEYWRNLPLTPDFVVMVVPDFALLPAMQQDPDLIDHALQKQVVLATFSTLVALLKCVAMGWQEKKVERESLEIAELGRVLHDRLYTFAGYLRDVGNALERAVSKYNESVGSFDSRVLVQARRFLELGVQTTRSLPESQAIDLSVRPLRNQPSDIDETETDASIME